MPVGRFAPWATIAVSPFLVLAVWSWWVFVIVVAVDAVVAVTELATLREWEGFWGEKNPDGTPRHRLEVQVSGHDEQDQHEQHDN